MQTVVHHVIRKFTSNSITTVGEVEENFHIQHSKMRYITKKKKKKNTEIVTGHNFYWGWCWLFPKGFPEVEEKKKISRDFQGFPVSEWSNFFKKFSIQQAS